MLNMISLLTANGMPMGDRLAYALRMLIVGLGMVFVVLAILWGVLELLRIFLHGTADRRKSEAKGETNKADKVVPAPAPVVAPAPVKSDDALIAVITAAIAAAMAEEGSAPVGGFRVVSFRRATGNHPWNRK